MKWTSNIEAVDEVIKCVGGMLQKGVVVGVFDNGKELELTCAGREIDQNSGGKLTRQLNEYDIYFELKATRHFVLVIP